MKTEKILGLILLSLGLGACGKGVAVMGIDDKGSVREFELSKEQYAKHMGDLLKNVDSQALPTIERASRASKWKLKTVVIGLGLRMEAGIGPYKAGFEPRLRLAYAKDSKAPIP